MSESDTLLSVLLDNQYQITELVGKGGMATVYKATQKSINRTVAVKVLPRSFLHDDTFMQRFQQEAEVIARLEHFHILPIYDYGEYDGMPFIVMRYLEGGTLQKRIEQGPLPWEDIVRITAQVAQALDYAHARNIIHRDIKPSNVLLDGSGNAYLADFGIAKMSESTAQLTGSGIVGTPAYMAPEQSRPGPPTPAVDIYALGVTVFEMVTGQQPYRADTPIAQILMHLQNPIPSVREYNPDVPAPVDEVIAQAMAKQPDERFPTASELARALEAAVRKAGGWDASGATVTMAEGVTPPAATPQAPTYEAPRYAASTSIPREPTPPTAAPPITPPKPAAKRGVTSLLLIGGGVVGLLAIVAVVAGVLLSGIGQRAIAPPITEPPQVENTAAMTSVPSVEPEAAVVSDEATPTATNEPPPAPTEPVAAEPNPTPLADRITLRGVPMVLVPAGPFIMGLDTGYPRERPAHEVYLDDYYIDETEVTNLYYMACVDAGGCPPPEFVDSPSQVEYYGYETFHNFPVIYISWEEAQNYCRWRGGHLPTEAQWEKAAAWDPDAGAHRLFPWGGPSLDPYYLNYASNFGHTTAGDNYPAGRSAYGLFDMAGNLQEWVYDWYQDNYYEVSPRENPTGPASGEFKVLRGGSYESNGSDLTTSFRDYIGPGFKKATIGFRCAMTPSGDPTTQP